MITGIGFIGGGAILKAAYRARNRHAASVWNACVIGAAVAMNHTASRLY